MQNYSANIQAIIAHLCSIKRELTRETAAVEQRAHKYDLIRFSLTPQEAEEEDKIGYQLDALEEQTDAIETAIAALSTIKEWKG